ncbi:MAG TPA: hypothetical protein VFA94_16625 [Acidimicrobiales bacterium]|nr:hypothetical protein [Acidimicrobiales bacterium]
MLKVVVCVVIFLVIMRVSLGLIRSIGRPVPPPAPPGALRKVNLRYRCSICGTEVKMTAAPDELPEPPRHCLEDMQLVAPAIE